MTQSNEILSAPRWMTIVLKSAGIYNLCWGTWVILFPLTSLRLCGFDQSPTYPELWQCIGMIVGVYGIGYWIAANSPYHHWPIVLVGFLGKIFGPIGFLSAWIDGRLPASAGIINIFNDLIWLIPFTMILWRSLKYHQAKSSESSEILSLDEAIRTFRIQNGKSLKELSDSYRTMLIFLRHAGCTFCREALAEVSRHRQEIEQNGIKVTFVHMDSEENMSQLFDKYHLSDVARISDPDQQLYRAAGIGLGTWNQLLSWNVISKGFLAAIIHRHGFSRASSNMFRMPGAVIIYKGEIIDRFEAKDASDHPDFCELSQVS